MKVAVRFRFLLVATFFLSTFARDITYSGWHDWGFYGLYPRVWYKSFNLGAPRINFLQWSDQCGNGYTMLTPRGFLVWHPAPTIVDGRGNLVWTDDGYGMVTDLKVQRYRGEDYLTFWSGWNGADHTYSVGVYYMLDSAYEVYKVIQPTGALKGDLHEFKLTDEGTALMTVYSREAADLSTIGGPEEGWILESSFHEVDIETGELLFQWHASEHHSLDEVLRPFEGGERPSSAFDWFHINSVDKDEEGNYYISARYLHTITCVDPMGNVKWILGGRRNSFTDLSDGAATGFRWQHDAKLQGNGAMTIFDNAKSEKTNEKNGYSRGMLVSLDVEDMTATLEKEFISPHRLLAQSQGSAQIVPETGNVVVGWGFLPTYTEFNPDGQVKCNARFGPPSWAFSIGLVTSYRTFKSLTWVGQPKSPPDVYLRPSDSKLYVSWNGATEVGSWILQGADFTGVREGEWSDIATIYKETFESVFVIKSNMPKYLRVSAVDGLGSTVGNTEVLDRKIGNAPSRLRQYFIVCVVSTTSILAFGLVLRKRLARSWLVHRIAGLRIRSRRDYKAASEHELRPLYVD